jgi:hypothetical protein
MKISIPITVVQVEGGGYHLTVKSRFSSFVGGFLIIDTGASMSAFDRETCIPFSEENFQVSEIQSSGITSESLHAKPVHIKKIYIGRFRFEISQAVVLDLSHIKHLYEQFAKKNIIGLLGSNFLKEHNAIIDYKNNLLYLDI